MGDGEERQELRDPRSRPHREIPHMRSNGRILSNRIAVAVPSTSASSPVVCQLLPLCYDNNYVGH